jgi:hypothetical protein
MIGLDFEVQPSVVASDPNRADIACFVGLVARRATSVPEALRQWLRAEGWIDSVDAKSNLLDLPVPIDTWDVFDRLFAWDERPLDDKKRPSASYLGAAVRSYFAQGGRKCYVVRTGDPLPYTANSRQRLALVPDLIPGYPKEITASPLDRKTWRGIGNLFGLPDVSFLCLPDLPDLFGVDREKFSGLDEFRSKTDPAPEEFVECSEGGMPRGDDGAARLFPAPRCGRNQMTAWSQAVRKVAEFIGGKANGLREIQFIAAIPIPLAARKADSSQVETKENDLAAPERDLLEFFTLDNKSLSENLESGGFASAFLQLAYPWARTAGSGNLPEMVESPDAILAGVLARNALTRGAYRSGAGSHMADVYETFPSLRRAQTLKPHPDKVGGKTAHALIERVSLLGPTPGGHELLSDVTTSVDESYRPANVNRLVSVIVRAARRLGEDHVFEASGERLWAQFRDALNGLMLNLWRSQALRGVSPRDAFTVRCDRTTMTQNDIDNGRVIAIVEFDAAPPIEKITVVLAMNEGGQVSRSALEAAMKGAA